MIERLAVDAGDERPWGDVGDELDALVDDDRPSAAEIAADEHDVDATRARA